MVEYGDLIGLPFVYGGRGPEEYDCYGLLQEMWRRAHGVELPEFTSPTLQGPQAAVGAIQLLQWQEVPCAPHVMVAIRIGRFVSHCGFMVDQQNMIHAWQQAGGVSVQRLGVWKQRITGFYRYVG